MGNSLADPQADGADVQSYLPKCLVSVDRGVISRLSLAGRVLAESLPFEHDGRFYVYWGMTRGPDGHLYLAAHESEGGSVPP